MDDGVDKDLLLLDVSSDEIRDIFDALEARLTRDDRLIVYYAGHGILEGVTDTAYWVPANAKSGRSRDLIPASDITRALRRVNARSVLVLSDSCYSGALFRDGPSMKATNEERERTLYKLAEQTSRVVITSGGDEPVLDGGGSGHSIFARKLIDALRSPDQAIFSAQELFVTHLLPSVSGNAAQQPKYGPLRQSGHETGDFVFVHVSRLQGGGR